MKKMTGSVDVARIEEAIRMLNANVEDESVKPFISILEVIQQEPDNESLLVQLYDAFQNLGIYQGAVLTYLEDMSQRIKNILDAKYEPADLDEVIKEQTELSTDEKQKLRVLLDKYSDLFDGTLGKWKGSPVELKLKPDAEPYHAKAFPVPRVHMDTLKQEVERLCKIV